MSIRRACWSAVAASVTVPSVAAAAGTVPVRVATYNVAADINGNTTVDDAAVTTVLGGIGNANPDGVVRPVDILALQETTSNAVTVAPIAADLNALYKTTAYTVPALQPGQSSGSPTFGNGPNSIVYNAATLQLVSAAVVGPANGSGNGVYRQVARYQFRPAAALGGTAAGDFFVYVEHAKSGSTAADQAARAKEATIVRADADALPANSRVLYVGDFNVGASTEDSFTTMTAAGAGQAFDPIDTPGNYALNSALRGTLTESSTNLRYRDDFQLVTGNVAADATGLRYATSSYTAFGNNGTTAVYGSVAAASNTALPGLANRTDVLSALTTVTDHLPVVADYADVVGPTVANWALATGGTWGTVPDWTTTIVPTGAGAAVTFGPLSAAGTVTLDGSRTVGRVTLGSAAAYTLAAGTGGTLTVDDAGDLAGVAPAIAVTAGSHTVAAPLSLAAGVTVRTVAGTGLTIAGPVTGSGTLTVAGTVTIAATGTLGVATAVPGSLTFAANPTAAVLVRTVPSLSVPTGGRVTVAPGGDTLLVTPSLAVAGQVDLTSNDLVVSGGDVAAVTALAAAGFNGGRWTGPGLASATAAADAGRLSAIGVVPNAVLGYASFDGRPVAASDVLVRFTIYGDANDDGRVNAADYTRLDAGAVGHLTGWVNGDFNYDGVVDGADYALADNAFNRQASVATPAAAAAAVPEPAAVIGAVVVAGLGRRRSRRRA